MCAAARATVVRPVSIGWRSDSSVCLGNSGSSSRNSTPRCARLISPGLRPLPAAGQRRLRRRMVRLAERRVHHQPAAVQHAGDAVDHADLQRLLGRRGRAAGRAAAPPASTCRTQAGRSSAGCVHRRRRSPPRAWRSPCPSRRPGPAHARASATPAVSGGVSTWVPRKWLISDSRSAAASTSMRPAHAASPPWLAGQISPRSSVEAPIAAGSTPGHRVQSAVQRQLAECRVAVQVLARHHLHRRQHAQRDRQVEVAAFLQQVGRRQVDQHPPRRQRQAHGAEGRTHPLARLAHRLVGQPDQQQGGRCRWRSAPAPRPAPPRCRRRRRCARGRWWRRSSGRSEHGA